jgi:hypothetical protein
MCQVLTTRRIDLFTYLNQFVLETVDSAIDPNQVRLAIQDILDPLQLALLKISIAT